MSHHSQISWIIQFSFIGKSQEVRIASGRQYFGHPARRMNNMRSITVAERYGKHTRRTLKRFTQARRTVQINW